jgi:hypothetical protein
MTPLELATKNNLLASAVKTGVTLRGLFLR